MLLITEKKDRLKILQSFSETSESNRKWSQFPEGYIIGRTKYIFVTGGVISGIGKGITSASIGQLLQNKGFNCNPIKLESYYNRDSGTLNPFEHGEVYVLDGGLETDMDLGTYESMLNKNLSKYNFFTNGMLDEKISKLEREGVFGGKSVQFFPHKVGEVGKFIRKSSMKSNTDITLVEIGGKVGDEESRVYLKAMQPFADDEGKENVFFIHNVFILEPEHLGEQKTWPAQQSIDDFSSLVHIRPDLVVLRSKREPEEGVKRKIGKRCLGGEDKVASAPDLTSIYLVPGHLEKQGIDKRITNYFHLKSFKVSPDREKWGTYTTSFLNPEKEINIGILGKYIKGRDTYASILKAVEHAATHHKTKANIVYVDTEKIEKESGLEEKLKDISGIIVPGGFGERGTEGKIQCVNYARENNIPYLGLCYGFQMAAIEFARNVCNLKDANTEEIVENLKHPVICLLPDQWEKEGIGGNMRLGGQDIKLVPNTKAWELYHKNDLARERFRHRYEFNPKYRRVFEEKGIIFSGMTPNEEIMQILELPNHPFFIGVQFHPEFSSKPLQPNPLYLGFVKEALKK